MYTLIYVHILLFVVKYMYGMHSLSRVGQIQNGCQIDVPGIYCKSDAGISYKQADFVPVMTYMYLVLINLVNSIGILNNYCHFSSV